MTDQNEAGLSRTELAATERLCAKLGELGVEHEMYVLPNGEHGVSWIDGNGIEWEAVQQGENFEIHALQLVTTEQAIAATVGDKPKADITGLHATVNAAITGIVRNARCFSDYRTATEHINDNGDVTAIHECVKRAATVGRSCASCPEMDNPDSYIAHLHRALEVADGGVGTCKNVSTTGNFRCSECDATDLDFDKPTYCHGCGRKVVDE